MLVVTSLIGTVLYLFIGGFRVDFSTVSVFWSLLFALVMIPYYMIGIKVLSLGSLALYSMFMMLGGMLVPFFYGVLFLRESVSVAQVIGTVLLTGFIIMQAISQSDSNTTTGGKQSAKTKVTFFVLCLIIFFLNGLTGVIAKAHQISERAVDEVSFTVISCALTAIFSLILLAFEFLRDRKEKSRQMMTTLKIKPMGIMVLIGATTYTGNFLHLLAANDVPASVQFPLVSGGVIVLSALVSFFAFKEKMSVKERISIGGAFLSTVLFAF
jgi:drug/metabolite transporter (DMT)-like permease